MASRTLPGLGLRAFYNIGEDGWGDAMNEDLRKLSVLVMPVVFSLVTELPDSPVDGDRHILLNEDSNSGAEDSIILFDVDTWIYIAPSEGWEVYNIGDSTKYRFVGGSWVAPSGGTVSAAAVSYDAGDTGDSNSTQTTAQDALDDLYARIRNIVSGGGVDAAAVTYSGGDEGDSNSVEITVAAALDDLYQKLRVLDPAFFFVGGTGDNNRRITYVVSRPFILPVSLTGSQTWAETPTTDDSNSASLTFDIQKNGASIGSIVFDGGSQTATFTFASAISFAAGDRLGIVAPASMVDIAGVSITLLGARIT